MSRGRFAKELDNLMLKVVNTAAPLAERYDKLAAAPQWSETSAEMKRLMDRIKTIKEDAMDEAEEIYTSYCERLDKKYRNISGKQIDDEDMKLLNNPYYAMDQEQFDALQDRHEGNLVMEKILAEYAERKNRETSDGELLLGCRFITVDKKKTLARECYRQAISFIDNGGSHEVSEYVKVMAGGGMFANANNLME